MKKLNLQILLKARNPVRTCPVRSNASSYWCYYCTTALIERFQKRELLVPKLLGSWSPRPSRQIGGFNMPCQFCLARRVCAYNVLRTHSLKLPIWTCTLFCECCIYNNKDCSEASQWPQTFLHLLCIHHIRTARGSSPDTCTHCNVGCLILSLGDSAQSLQPACCPSRCPRLLQATALQHSSTRHLKAFSCMCLMHVNDSVRIMPPSMRIIPCNHTTSSH